MSAPLQFSCSLSSKTVPVSATARLVYLLLEVGGGEGAQALPSNLGFVIDVSDSMRIRLVSDQQFAELIRNGQAQEVMTDGVPAYQITSAANGMMETLPRRIDYVSEALLIASEFLRPTDCYSLIAFAGRAQCMICSVTGKERMRLHQAARELEYLRLGDGTQMAEGMAMAFEELQRQKGREYTSRMILLTDGHTQNVSGCYHWADQARQAGMKVTTMGIGVEFNEDLLIPLADRTGGNAYYVETPDQIPDVFRKELGAALRISYRNVEIKLQLAKGVELRHVYRALPELGNFDQGPEMDSSYGLWVGDYDPAAPVALLAELVVPAWPAGVYRLAQAMLSWVDPGDEVSRRILRQDIVIQTARMLTARLDERVMNIVEKVGAFKMGTLALEAAQHAAQTTDAGERGAATVRLRQAATRLLDMGEPSLASAMLQQADSLESKGSLDPEATKRLRYETRRLTQHL